MAELTCHKLSFRIAAEARVTKIADFFQMSFPSKKNLTIFCRPEFEEGRLKSSFCVRVTR
jgi:hypothetical protein